MGPSKYVKVKQSIFLGAPNVINEAGRAFLLFKLISPPYTTSYQISSYHILHIFQQ